MVSSFRLRSNGEDPSKQDMPSFLECYEDFINQTDLIDIRATADD